MFYLPQSSNPNKHALMPDYYPWQVSHLFINGFIEISQEELSQLMDMDISAYAAAIAYEKNLERQRAQREFGLYLVPELIDLMGARNLSLIQAGVSVNIPAIASDNASIKLLIETGALSTARSICTQLKRKYPYHVEIYDHVIEDITEFLTENGYE